MLEGLFRDSILGSGGARAGGAVMNDNFDK